MRPFPMKTLRPVGIALLLVSFARLLCAQPSPPPRPAGGPWNQDVDVWRVPAAGEVRKLATFERAGVPSLARLADGRLIAAHQYFPAGDPANFDKVAVHSSDDEGATWTAARVIGLAGLPEGLRFPFDPTLVPLPDGRVRLYFTSLRGRRFDQDRPAIYSAISQDGIDYTFEPGVRFGVEGRPVIDCAVVRHDGVFHLFAPDNGAQLEPGRPRDDASGKDAPRLGVGYHATSRDGLNFTRVADVQIEGRRRWLGGAFSEGTTITFLGTGEPGAPMPGERRRGGLWMGTSSDGETWTPVTFAAVPGADPGAVRARSDGWIVISSSEPRRNDPPPERSRAEGGRKAR